MLYYYFLKSNLNSSLDLPLSWSSFIFLPVPHTVQSLPRQCLKDFFTVFITYLPIIQSSLPLVSVHSHFLLSARCITYVLCVLTREQPEMCARTVHLTHSTFAVSQMYLVYSLDEINICLVMRGMSSLPKAP